MISDCPTEIIIYQKYILPTMPIYTMYYVKRATPQPRLTALFFTATGQGDDLNRDGNREICQTEKSDKSKKLKL